ncbi:unnamed protein product [Echinostoma caproni]|uniref:RanBP2-type domain-containing protein n=1 Tax=Echinostoma caproni TaxID=27848 RepID=A0A183A8E4_9TREM|nr:unnamed protein product [Echinostoma caproni]
MAALRMQLERNRPREPALLAQVRNAISQLATLGETMQLSIRWYRENWYRTRLAPLYAETYDIPHEETPTPAMAAQAAAAAVLASAANQHATNSSYQMCPTETMHTGYPTTIGYHTPTGGTATNSGGSGSNGASGSGGAGGSGTSSNGSGLSNPDPSVSHTSTNGTGYGPSSGLSIPQTVQHHYPIPTGSNSVQQTGGPIGYYSDSPQHRPTQVTPAASGTVQHFAARSVPPQLNSPAQSPSSSSTSSITLHQVPYSASSLASSDASGTGQLIHPYAYHTSHLPTTIHQPSPNGYSNTSASTNANNGTLVVSAAANTCSASVVSSTNAANHSTHGYSINRTDSSESPPHGSSPVMDVCLVSHSNAVHDCTPAPYGSEPMDRSPLSHTPPALSHSTGSDPRLGRTMSRVSSSSSVSSGPSTPNPMTTGSGAVTVIGTAAINTSAKSGISCGSPMLMDDAYAWSSPGADLSIIKPEYDRQLNVESHEDTAPTTIGLSCVKEEEGIHNASGNMTPIGLL